MIDKTHDLPVARQAKLLELSRSSIYYRPQPTPESDLRLMRRIDELHLDHPFAGARMLRDMLKLEGIEIGRKHVGTLMKKMGIEATSPPLSLLPAPIFTRCKKHPPVHVTQRTHTEQSVRELVREGQAGRSRFDRLRCCKQSWRKTS